MQQKSQAHNLILLNITQSTLTLGKWQKRGAINNSTRIIIKTTGMLQSCQRKKKQKTCIMKILKMIKIFILLVENTNNSSHQAQILIILLQSRKVYELTKLQFDVSTIFTERLFQSNTLYAVQVSATNSYKFGNIDTLLHSHARYRVGSQYVEPQLLATRELDCKQL